MPLRPAPRLIAATLLLLPGLFPGIAQAVRFYDVEMIVFAQQDSNQGASEYWPQRHAAGTPGADNENDSRAALDFLGNQQGLASRVHKINLLPREDKRLGGARSQLARSSKFRPLLHLAWRQPGLDKAHAPRLRIHNGKRLATDFDQQAPVSASTATSAVNTSANGQAISSPARPPSPIYDIEELDGSIQITRGRYLHIDTDLQFYRRLPTSYGVQLPTSTRLDESDSDIKGRSSTRLYRFDLKQTRRMRRDEIHYLDHPLFGMIITIHRAPIPEVSDDEFFGRDS